MWATTLPPEMTATSGTGNTWIPITAIKCGTDEITCIEVSEENSVVAVGDVAGNVSLWSVPNSSSSGFKRLFSTTLDSQVSSMTMSNEGKILVVGTEDGSLYDLKDWAKSDMEKIDSLDHIGGSGKIMKCLISPCWKGTSYTNAIFVVYHSGHYGIVDVNTHQLLSFCASGSNPIDLSEADETDNNESEIATRIDSDQVVFACVMRSNYEIITKIPELEEVKDVETSEVKITPTKDVIPAHETRKSFGFFKKSNSPSPQQSLTPPQGKNSTTVTAPVFPAAAPRYFVFIRGRYLVICDLEKFSLPSVSDRSPSIVFSNALPNAVKMKCIGEGEGPFIAAQNISIIEDSTRFWSQPIPCLSAIDSEGNSKILSIPSGDLVSISPVLPDVFSEDFHVKCSTILPNGNAYLSTSSYMIYSSTPENKDYPQVAPVPCRACANFTIPPRNQMLQVTIGDKDAAEHVKTKNEKKDKRRTSVMSFAMSGPVDFQKLFSKSLDVRRKEELFGSAFKLHEDDEDDNDNVNISSTNVKGTTGKAATTKAALDETRQAFEERGERMDRINKKLEDFGEGAKLYKKQSAQHKERMRKKAERWGFF